VGVTAALAHTHAPGNVGLRGEASCPACRASGVTLTDEQRALVDELLAPLLDAGDVFYTTAGEDAVRVALIEVVLRSAEQERNRCRERLAITATAYEENARGPSPTPPSCLSPTRRRRTSSLTPRRGPDAPAPFGG
jgi:hypothetical protein